MKPTPEQSAIDKLFQRSLSIDGPLKTQCLIWQGAKDKHGYGQIRVGGKLWLVHRYAQYIRTGNELKDNVCHKCDNPSCWAEDHLWEGTQQANITDMVVKGRHRRGQGYWQALTEAQQAELIHLSREGWSQRRLAVKYNIAQSSVGNYIRRAS
jgi:hypothetical protein